eukprot:GHVS01015391.1.p1 GENE.GHVS01015391.1~~GHVS01015391.1.p1  ORF type:complete len:107 (-),score=14.69 GHVS01015391.1:588-908(-)
MVTAQPLYHILCAGVVCSLGIPLIAADGFFRYMGGFFMIILALGLIGMGKRLKTAIEVRNNSRPSVEDSSPPPPLSYTDAPPSYTQSLDGPPPDLLPSYDESTCTP